MCPYLHFKCSFRIQRSFCLILMVLAKKMLLDSHKKVFIKNDAMHNYAGIGSSICSCNLVYSFLIQLLRLQRSVFVVDFSNAFWHGNEAFPKGSSQNEIFPLLVIFHLAYSKYRGVKICFYSCRYQNQNFQIKNQYSCHTLITFVLLVLLVSGASVVTQTRSY